jgi:hypothetical protein
VTRVLTLDELPVLLTEQREQLDDLRRRVAELEAQGHDELADQVTVAELLDRYAWLREGTLRDWLKHRDANGLGRHVIDGRPLLIDLGGFTHWLRCSGRQRGAL